MGDHHALLDFVRYMQILDLNNGDYLVIGVQEDVYDPKQKYFNKCEFKVSVF